MKRVKKSKYMVNSWKLQTAIANAHEEIGFSSSKRQALKGNISTSAEMNNSDYVASQR